MTKRGSTPPQPDLVAPKKATAVATLEHLPKLPPGGQASPAKFAPACATFRRFLRDKGLKFTPERAAVLDLVLRQPPLFDAETLADQVKREGHRGSRATVYRTLGHLQESGLIRQIVFGNGHGYYEVVQAGGGGNDYLVDVETGEIIPFKSEALEAARDEVCREMGVEPVRHQFHVFVRRPKA